MVKKNKAKREISNRLLYTLIAAGIFSLFAVGVYAYNTNNPSNFGHSAGEIEFPQLRVKTTLDSNPSGGGSPTLCSQSTQSFSGGISAIPGTLINFNYEYFDDGNFHSSVSPTKFTVPSNAGGLYVIGAGLYSDNAPPGDSLSIVIWKNGILSKGGTRIAEILYTPDSSISTPLDSGSVSVIDKAVAGDYYQVEFFHTDSSNIKLQNCHTNFWMTKIQ